MMKELATPSKSISDSSLPETTTTSSSLYTSSNTHKAEICLVIQEVCNFLLLTEKHRETARFTLHSHWNLLPHLGIARLLMMLPMAFPYLPLGLNCWVKSSLLNMHMYCFAY